MRRVALIILISGCSISSGDSIVTEPVRYLEVDLTLADGDLAAIAPDYVLGTRDLGGDELVPLSTIEGPDGLRHVRLQQVHDGVPVFGSEVVVHADDSTFLGYGGVLTRNLDGLDTAPALGGDDALAIAMADRGSAIETSRQEKRLVILPREGDGEGADLVWEIELADDQPSRWFYFVAAADGAIVGTIDGLATVFQASGPGGNPKVARRWDDALDVDEEGGAYLMKTDRQITIDLAHATKGGEPARAAALDGFGDPVVNDAHGFTEITLDMMRDWAATDSIDGKGAVIVARVHFGENIDAAAWDGEHTNFGDSDPAQRYPRPGALDIVAHETNHGFTERHSHLVYAQQSGGLNESFSDVAGTMAEFFHEGDAADLDIGEDIYVASGGMHRSMCDPVSTGSIDHMKSFNRTVGVHSSSGIGNKAFCLAVGRFKAMSGGATTEAVRRAGLAWYAANAGYWTSTSTYTEACQGVVDGARSLGYSSEEVAAINQSWADVGVHCDGAPLVCDGDDSCDVTDGETCASCPGDCGACSDDCGLFRRLKCTLGLADCSRCDRPESCGDGVCAGDEDDHTCAEDCGCAAAAACGSVGPVGCYCDGVCHLRGDCCADRDEVCGS
jgi:Zn-dependent metalloprotease